MLKARMINFFKKQLATKINKKIRYQKNDFPILSFTFDDFPHTSYSVGGKLLNAFNFKATYYCSLGLLDQNLPVGKAFSLDDLKNLLSDGHELGCHTYDHHDAWKTNKNIFERSIKKNSVILKNYFPDIKLVSFSYPKTFPSPGNKLVSGEFFQSCRGGGQKFNSKKIDLNLLQSYFIDKKNNKDICFLKNYIDLIAETNGWLIISTHDISEFPSDFGCSIEYFKEIVQYVAIKNKIKVLTVSDAINNYCPMENGSC